MKGTIATIGLGLMAVVLLFGGYGYWKDNCKEVYNNPTEATEEFIGGAWHSNDSAQEAVEGIEKDKTRVFGCIKN